MIVAYIVKRKTLQQIRCCRNLFNTLWFICRQRYQKCNRSLFIRIRSRRDIFMEDPSPENGTSGVFLWKTSFSRLFFVQL